jgi:hypothetical protein
MTTVDSDDRLVPDALERLFAHWLPGAEQRKFSGIVGLCL